MISLCPQITAPTRSPALITEFQRTGPWTQPFRTAEEAWFWTVAALHARREGATHSGRASKVPRPCEPDDVLKCLDLLYRRGRVGLMHARVLRVWGERQVGPNPAHVLETADARLWHQAMGALEGPLRTKGITA